MAKFQKEKKVVPSISTSSLPDVVFMLLFFFMASTSLRDTEYKIKEPVVPNARSAKKIEDKNLMTTIYVGKSKDESQKGDVIQLNDKISSVNDVKPYILTSKANKSEDEQLKMITVFRVDKGAKVGTISDIKKELRDIDALKIAYAAVERKE